MKVSHVLYKTNNLEASFKEFEKLGYKVEKQEIEDEDTGWNYSYNIKNK